MNPTATHPFVVGALVGLGLPLLALVLLALLTDLRAWLELGALYNLMPVFLLLGLPSFFLTRRLRVAFVRRNQRSLLFTHGAALGAWLVGVVLLWLSNPDASLARRILVAASGSVMLVAFWIWIGSLLGQIEPRKQSGSSDHTQDISSPPR